MFQILLIIIYLVFINLGLSDSLLGSAWPSMYPDFDVPISYAGIISMLISIGTISASLLSHRLNRKFGTGKIIFFCISTTAIALFGFSISNNFLLMCLWAIPYGFGAGSGDASLNNYVTLHYKSRHVSWLHCMWSIGATIGPYIMGYTLTSGHSWSLGYRYVGMIQISLVAILFFSLPLWNRKDRKTESHAELKNQDEIISHTLSLRETIKITGAKEAMLRFFCYCALEATTGLWASSYLTLHKGVPADQAAGFVCFI